MFPEIRDQLINIFERYRHVLDAELQQRACEYLAIAQRADDNELLETVCEEMPPFPERESALLNRLHSKGKTGQDRRTWVIGGKGDNKDREADRFKSFRQDSKEVDGNGDAAKKEAADEEEDTAGEYDLMGADPSAGGVTDLLDSLSGLDLSGGAQVANVPLIVDHQANDNLLGGMSQVSSPSAETPPVMMPATVVALAAMSLTKGPNVDKVGHSFHLCDRLELCFTRL